MQPKNVAKEWIALAEQDLNSAKFLCSMHPQPLEIICYHCQQSAEKFLKGFLAYHNNEVLKTHDLNIIVQQCTVQDDSFAELSKEASELTDFAINVRYPYPLDINEFDKVIALKNADTVRQFVLNRL